MSSFQAKIIKMILNLQPYSWAKGSILEQRSRQENSTRFFKIPDEIECTQVFCDDVSAEWIASTSHLKGVILYLHGGAYALGSINVHREYLSRLAIRTRLRVFAINYRLAPEQPFPAALEDSLKAYHWLLSQGCESSDIAIAGDSAGGGLALSTLVALRNASEPLPACAVVISPWVDLTLSGNSIRENAQNDPILSPKILESFANIYVGDNKTNNPLISPLFADLHGLPPLLIHVGTNEILLDDAHRILKKALLAGVEAKLKTWEGLFHVFQVVGFIPETELSLKHISQFIVEHIYS